MLDMIDALPNNINYGQKTTNFHGTMMMQSLQSHWTHACYVSLNMTRIDLF